MGVRAIAGSGTGFAYADSLALPALLDAADSARAISQRSGEGRVRSLKLPSYPERYQAIDPTGDGDSARRSSCCAISTLTCVRWIPV